MQMIWDDPWVLLASRKGGTRIPPPSTPLAEGQRFCCEQVGAGLDLSVWNDLIGSRWRNHEVAARLEGAWIPCLYNGPDLVGTCVLRKKEGGFWILETLRAIKGYGGPLLRAVIPWLARWGPFTLGYTWELSAPALVGAWWKGWLCAADAADLQYGWIWTSEGCSFCPSGWKPIDPANRLLLPTLFQDASGSAIVSDSGLGDGWGYMSVFSGAPEWSAICQKGGWKALWMRSATGPKGWAWTGEFVVLGFISYGGVVPESVDWVTAEITSG